MYRRSHRLVGGLETARQGASYRLISDSLSPIWNPRGAPLPTEGLETCTSGVARTEPNKALPVGSPVRVVVELTPSAIVPLPEGV